MEQFSTARGDVSWKADAQGIEIVFRRRTRRLRWDDITAAGLAHYLDAEEIPDLPTRVLPGLGEVFNIYGRMAREERLLVLARGRSTFRAVRIPIPAQEPGALAMVDEVRRNLGDKWIGEVPMEDHQAALEMSTPWWFYPLFGVGFVIFGYTVFLAIAAFEALTSGGFAEIPPIAWLALFIWVVLIGGVLLVNRGRW